MGIPFQLENKTLITIHNGEYYVSSDPQVVIYTLLGSCISVCLYDQVSGIGGMSHFMLPESIENQFVTCGHYELHSLETMMNHLLSEGAVFQNIKAKVFGGSNMVDFHNREKETLFNIQWTLKYLESKRIPIMAKELGGGYGRKIYYVLKDHSVYVQRLLGEQKELDESGYLSKTRY